ncbi:MAG TPA: transporter [Allosphingosinicella sp.]|nr:transporter [Allosphingosinicella sp.]
MRRIGLAILLGLCAAPVAAQTGAGATPPPDDQPICTDRPGKGNGACTVPAGAVQLETDIFNWTRDSGGGTRTDTILYTNPVLKFGLSDSADLQLNIAPYEEVRTKTGNVTDRIGGVGDLFVRYKQRLTGASANIQIAIIPFIKLPTARRGLGNGAVEGGLALPVNINLPQGFTLNFSPEADLILDADGSGRHISLQNIVNVGKQVGKVNVAVEIWGGQDFDPAGTVQQVSADVMVTWLARKTLQFDVGANFGLNRNTPDLQLYAGVSTRF